MRQLLDLQRHEEELRRRAQDEDEDAYPCKLCGVQLQNVAEIQAHLKTDDHRQRAAKMADLLADVKIDI